MVSGPAASAFLELVRNANSWSYPSPPTSETLGVEAPPSVFQPPSPYSDAHLSVRTTGLENVPAGLLFSPDASQLSWGGGYNHRLMNVIL